jgi:hypothetical protein
MFEFVIDKSLNLEDGVFLHDGSFAQFRLANFPDYLN